MASRSKPDPILHGNPILSDAEVTSTQYVCNGVVVPAESDAGATAAETGNDAAIAEDAANDATTSSDTGTDGDAGSPPLPCRDALATFYTPFSVPCGYDEVVGLHAGFVPGRRSNRHRPLVLCHGFARRRIRSRGGVRWMPGSCRSERHGSVHGRTSPPRRPSTGKSTSTLRKRRRSSLRPSAEPAFSFRPVACPLSEDIKVFIASFSSVHYLSLRPFSHRVGVRSMEVRGAGPGVSDSNPWIPLARSLSDFHVAAAGDLRNGGTSMEIRITSSEGEVLAPGTIVQSSDFGSVVDLGVQFHDAPPSAPVCAWSEPRNVYVDGYGGTNGNFPPTWTDLSFLGTVTPDVTTNHRRAPSA